MTTLTTFDINDGSGFRSFINNRELRLDIITSRTYRSSITTHALENMSTPRIRTNEHELSIFALGRHDLLAFRTELHEQ